MNGPADLNPSLMPDAATIADQLAAVEAKLDRLLAILDAAPAPVARLLTVAALADALGVSRDYVYEHADELGAIRLGLGPRGPLRFPADAATARQPSRRSLTTEPPAREGTSSGPATTRKGTQRVWRPIHAPKEPPRGPSRAS